MWAQEINGGIGKDRKLPWHISEDMQNFKKLTYDSTILMGRKTWESLPIKPLPKRRNIVLSNNKVFGVECYTSVKDCIEKLYDDGIIGFMFNNYTLFHTRGYFNKNETSYVPFSDEYFYYLKNQLIEKNGKDDCNKRSVSGDGISCKRPRRKGSKCPCTDENKEWEMKCLKSREEVDEEEQNVSNGSVSITTTKSEDEKELEKEEVNLE